MSRPGAGRLVLFGLAVAAFCLLATLNSGGYRYGVGDQAFYIPSIVRHLEPDLFPRDRPLLDAQNSLMVSDEVLAALVGATGVSLETTFLILYGVGLVLLAAALAAFGRVFYRSWMAVVALGAAATLRHRIARTGVNTLEGYMHPRIIAFAIGIVGISAILHDRHRTALALGFCALLIHPTIGLWFIIAITVAWAVNEPGARKPLAGIAVCGGVAAIWTLWQGPLSGRLARMDPTWLSVFEAKDYVLPTEWDAAAWALNLAYPIVLVFAYAYRLRAGLARPTERGIVAGALALFVLFLLSLPLIAMRVALAVQLQTSRLFWILDFLGVAYLVWLLVESPLVSKPGGRRVPGAVAALLTLVAAGRGAYIMLVEHPGRPIVEATLPAGDDWTQVMMWARTTPRHAGYLADPGHAWRYGTSLRVGAERDVFLEEVKDAALAMYSRPVALRVLERIQAVGDFATLDVDRALALGRAYDLQYLITEKVFPMPLAFEIGRFRVYSLTANPGTRPSF